MEYPKYKYSKKDVVLVLDEKQEIELGRNYFNSPVDADANYDYEGKLPKPSKVKAEE
jgi:hypothetical protein